MIALKRLLLSKETEFAKQYIQMFMVQHIERARAAGITDTRIKELVRCAVNQSTEYNPPDMLLRDLVDQEIKKDKQ